MIVTKLIEWEVKEDYPIKRWLGRVNGILFFEIYQFKNETFTDPFIMTSKIVPMEMKKHEDDLELLQEDAQLILNKFKEGLETEY